MLNRLVGRAIFADCDGVVGPDVQVRNLHEGGQTNGGTLVVGEHEEGAAVRTGVGAQQDAVGDAAHGELAHAKCSWRPNSLQFGHCLVAHSAGAKVAAPLRSVLLEPPRSAEPPQSSGMTAAMALSTEPEAPRVATPLPTSKVASRSSRALSKPSGSSPAFRRSYRAALSGLALRHASYFSSHSLWASRPRSATLRA